MNLNYVLLWFTIPVSILSIFRLARLAGQGAEILLYLFTLGVTGILLASERDAAGYVSFALMVGLFFIPGFLIRSINRQIFRQNFAAARQLAIWLCRIHPTPNVRIFPQVLAAVALGQQGDLQTAAKLLAPYRSLRTPLARNATVHLFRLQGDWEGLVEWVQAENIDLRTQPTIIAFYLRALGETGDLNKLAENYQRWLPVLEKVPDSLNLAQLFFLAFAGKVSPLDQLLKGRMGLYSPPIKEFWLATAEMAAGQLEPGKNRLQTIATPDRLIQISVQQRLAQPPPLASAVMSPATKQIIADAEQHIIDQTRYGRPGVQLHRHAYITYALILINVVVFGFEVLRGGSENIETLYQMGALVPSVVLSGEWWRVGAATFLHLGLLHLAMNMFALYLLGPFAERALGARKYLVAYLGSGCGSMFVIVWVAKMGWMQEQLVVGASGAIMGIIGATGAILLLARQSKVAAKRLRSIILIVVLQVVFDQTTPNISAMGHAAGVLIGFVLGLLLAVKTSARNEV